MVKGSRSPRQSAVCCREPPGRCCASSRALVRSNGHAQSYRLSASSAGVELVPLHGSLDGEAQDAAINRGRASTNHSRHEHRGDITDRAGCDGGHRYRARQGCAIRFGARHRSLTLERVTQDAADQRAGRAARLGPGIVRRLWDAPIAPSPSPRTRHRESRSRRPCSGSSGVGCRCAFVRVVRAAVGRPCSGGIAPVAAPRRHRRPGAHDGSRTAGPAYPASSAPCADSDRRARGSGDRGRMRVALRRRRVTRELAGELRRVASNALGGNVARHATDDELHHAMFVGYADRLARRRAGTRDRFVLATGHGAMLARESDVGDLEYVVALDIVAGGREGISEAKNSRGQSRRSAEWIQPTSTVVEHRIDANSGRVRAARVDRYDAIVLNETPIAVDPVAAAPLVRDAWLARRHDEPTTQLLRRLRFAAIDVRLPALVERGRRLCAKH